MNIAKALGVDLVELYQDMRQDEAKAEAPKVQQAAAE
jgi:hypothetical protein